MGKKLLKKLKAKLAWAAETEQIVEQIAWMFPEEFVDSDRTIAEIVADLFAELRTLRSPTPKFESEVIGYEPFTSLKLKPCGASFFNLLGSSTYKCTRPAGHTNLHKDESAPCNGFSWDDSVSMCGDQRIDGEGLLHECTRDARHLGAHFGHGGLHWGSGTDCKETFTPDRRLPRIHHKCAMTIGHRGNHKASDGFDWDKRASDLRIDINEEELAVAPEKEK